MKTLTKTAFSRWYIRGGMFGALVSFDHDAPHESDIPRTCEIEGEVGWR
jgi:hypothetical protein